jgi:RNA polymerase sigma-70 factor (ECF subfamily)
MLPNEPDQPASTPADETAGRPDAPTPPALDPGAVFERFSRRLIGLARGHLNTRLQYKVEPEDVVQSAYKSFFLRYGDGALAAEGWDGLWGLLTTITLRKCADRARFHRAERRDIYRESPLGLHQGGAAGAGGDADASRWLEAAGREPTPDQAAVLAETVEGLLRPLAADERTIVELSLQGCSTQEISEQTGRAERSVRRIRESIRKHLERQQLEESV